MNSFYSILFASIRPALKEQVSIAMLFRDKNRAYFHYSPSKLKAIKSLLPSSAYSLLRAYIKNIQESFDYENKTTEKQGNYLLIKNEKFTNLFNKEYIDYLSSYANNLITFTSPKEIDVEANEANFIKLFEKYVYGFEEVSYENVKISQVEKTKRSLYSSLKGRVNTNLKLTTKEVPNLFVPTHVDIIGTNNVPVAGQTFEFEKRAYDLENGIGRFISLIKAFELQDINDGKYFILGKEPKKAMQKNHDIWKRIHESKIMEFVPLNESDKLVEYVDDHKVRPFIEQSAEEGLDI